MRHRVPCVTTLSWEWLGCNVSNTVHFQSARHFSTTPFSDAAMLAYSTSSYTYEFTSENRNTRCLKQGKTITMHTVPQLLPVSTSIGHFLQLARRLCTMSCIVCRGVIMQQPLIKNCSLHARRILHLIMQLPFQWKWLPIQAKGTNARNSMSRAVALLRHYYQPHQGAIFART